MFIGIVSKIKRILNLIGFIALSGFFLLSKFWLVMALLSVAIFALILSFTIGILCTTFQFIYYDIYYQRQRTHARILLWFLLIGLCLSVIATIIAGII